jgi:hypothetical protein
MLFESFLRFLRKAPEGKIRAEQYWGPVAGGAIGTSGMPLMA